MREINEAIEKEKIEQMGEVRSKEREREKSYIGIEQGR